MNENSIWKNYLKLVQIGLTLILLSAVSIPLFLILPALLFFTTGIWIHAIYYTLMEALIISFFITGFTCIIIRVFGVILFKKISRSPSSSEYSYIYRLIFLGILAIFIVIVFMIFRAIISIILTSLLTIIVIIVYGYKQDQEKSIKKEIKQQNSP